uniref:DUF4371 domain-containing protein n=1 Tax=Amphimedon queenslandica TaxID=400682 RepID=A0A1X7V0R0_AMPQE
MLYLENIGINYRKHYTKGNSQSSDESTDTSSTKQLAIVVQFFCDENHKVKSKVFKLLEVSYGDETTPTTTILPAFHETDIPLYDLIGYASDITNVMFGQHHSVVSSLKKKIPQLFTMNSFCHTSHLCASYSCKRLPRAIEILIPDIYSQFSHSAKRIAEYEHCQHFTQTEPHKLLKPA